MILGLLALYQSDPNPAWYSQAETLAQAMLTHYTDPGGGFFDTRDDHEALLFRPKDTQDNATPSGSALATLALLQLSALSGKSEWRTIAEAALENMLEMATRYPTGFAQWLCALDFAIGPTQEVALLGEPDSPEFRALEAVLWAEYRPHLVAALSNFPPEARSPSLLSHRPLLNQKATAYVCRNFVCHQPVNTPEELKKQLEKI